MAKPKRISHAYLSSEVPPDPIAEEITASNAWDGFWMSLEEALELPAVDALDMPDVPMEEVFVLNLYGIVAIGRNARTGALHPVYAPRFPVVLWASDGGWYRVTGLEHQVPEMLARAEHFESQWAQAAAGRPN